MCIHMSAEREMTQNCIHDTILKITNFLSCPCHRSDDNMALEARIATDNINVRVGVFSKL
jgi:hypothetical protein